jgi:hypothetical protein
MYKKCCELAVGVCVFLAVPAWTCLAQVPGPNVNMVSGTSFPGGDPYLQKQNEGVLAVSTENPCHVVGGSNDYRAVNLPGLPDDREIGDAWVGLYKSTNCGQTWWSTLIPGYLQDNSPEGNASPAKGFTTGADPNVRAGLAGFFGYSFLAYNRVTGGGKLLLARLLDSNNKEAGDPIKYIDTTVWDSGSNGQFLDKPALAISAGKGTCTINGRTIPSSVVHMAWTVFVGNDQVIRTKVYYNKSSNCGATTDGPATKLSESYPINQGTAIAVNPIDGSVWIVWRQFESDKTVSAILFVKSTDGGVTFTKAAPVPLGSFQPFDQKTTNVSFRTNAYPTVTFDQFGRLYLGVASRGYAIGLPNQTRVVVTSTVDGVTWTPPSAVDADLANIGHQIMPALTYGGGKLNMIWYDFRDDAAGAAAKSESYVKEIYPTRHTLDVRGAQAAAQQNGALSWINYGVLQLPTPSVTAPRISQYVLGNYGGSPVVQQLQHNPPNYRLYAGGTRPFFGDYIDVAGLPFAPKRTPTGVQWLFNDGSFPTSGGSTFHAVWTDNRDVHMVPGNLETEGVDAPALGYSAPGPTCTAPTLTGTRDANIYTSRITAPLFVAAPGNAKPAVRADGTLIQRAFPVMAQNNTDLQRTFTMSIASQPTNGTASFAQTGPLVTSINVIIPKHSSVTRTVYVSSSDRLPFVQVNVDEVNNGTLSATTLLNPDIQNPDIQNPDIQNPDIQNPDIQNAEVHNPDIQNPDIQNPDIQNPDIQNPDIQNPDIQNPDIQNPDIQNPDIQNPDIQNPDIQNPDIQNPDIQNGAVNDYSVDVTNNGNTTSGFQVKATVSGDTSQFYFQLIGRRVYKTPAANGCTLTERGQNQILFNINNPDLGPLPDGFLSPNDPSPTNATVLLAPGETMKVTLRAINKDGVHGPAGTYTQFCPIVDLVGASCPAINTSVSVAVKAEAANTGSTTPPVAQTGADLFIKGTPIPTPSTVVPGDVLQLTNMSLLNFGQQTAAASGGFEVAGLISTDPTISMTDLTGGAIDGLGPIPAGGGVQISMPLQIPTLIQSGDIQVPFPPGNYYVGAFADSSNKVVETNETNNATSGEPITVAAPLAVTTGSLPRALQDHALSDLIQATGGVEPLTWAATSCASQTGGCVGNLPAGLTFSAGGLLSGVPTTPGSYSLTFTVTDASPLAANAPQLHSKSVTLTLDVAQLANITVGLLAPAPPVIEGVPFSVIVRVADNTGAVLPGVIVSLSLLEGPANGTLTPTNPTAVSDALGEARFTNLLVGPAGTGYVLLATVSEIGVGVFGGASAPFDVIPLGEPLSPAGATLKVQATPATAPPGTGSVLAEPAEVYRKE